MIQLDNLDQNTKTSGLTFVTFTGPSSVFKIVKMIMERNFQPVIIFSFSKKECEAYALQVAKLDFNRGVYVCNVQMSYHIGHGGLGKWLHIIR